MRIIITILAITLLNSCTVTRDQQYKQEQDMKRYLVQKQQIDNYNFNKYYDR